MPTIAAEPASLPTRLDTDRLVLRRHRRADAPALSAMLNNWNVVRWLDQVPYPYRDKDAIAWIEETERRWRIGADFQFVATLRRPAGPAGDESGAVIGQVGVHPSPEDPDAGELGYWLGEGHWGRGYASEAARAVVRFAFERVGLWRVVAVCLPDNGRSLSVLGRAGLCEVGRRRRPFHGTAGPVDVPFLRLTRRDYEAAEAAAARPAAE